MLLLAQPHQSFVCVEQLRVAALFISPKQHMTSCVVFSANETEGIKDEFRLLLKTRRSDRLRHASPIILSRATALSLTPINNRPGTDHRRCVFAQRYDTRGTPAGRPDDGSTQHPVCWKDWMTSPRLTTYYRRNTGLMPFSNE